MRNDDIGEILNVDNRTERHRKAMLRWFGHAKRRGNDNVGKKTLEIVLPMRRRRRRRRRGGRPEQICMDFVNRDIRVIGKTTDEVHDITDWRRIVSAAATPQLNGSGYNNKS